MKVSQAETLIGLAKEAISAYFDDTDYTVSEEVDKAFSEHVGVFVDLYVHDTLIGSMGYPEPLKPLGKSVADAARKAAFEDPRLPPLKKEQMKDLRIELSILTEPLVIKVQEPSEYNQKVTLGQDGLMIRDEFGVGVLLPQMAVKWRWDVKDYLNHTCRKAGLEPDCWDNERQNVFSFQVQIFVEEKGKIVEKNPSDYKG